MKSWLKFAFIFLLLFVTFGSVGGVTGIYAYTQYMISEGKLSKAQVSHARRVMTEMTPQEFTEMIKLLDKERLPTSERERLLFEERQRFKKEKERHKKDVVLWLEQKTEEQTRLRAEKLELDNARQELDHIREQIDSLNRQVKAEANKVKTAKYKQYIDTIKKMTPQRAAEILRSRPSQEIVEDLNQLKPATASEILGALKDFGKVIVDPKERDNYDRKMSEVVTLMRDGGLRIDNRRLIPE